MSTASVPLHQGSADYQSLSQEVHTHSYTDNECTPTCTISAHSLIHNQCIPTCSQSVHTHGYTISAHPRIQPVHNHTISAYPQVQSAHTHSYTINVHPWLHNQCITTHTQSVHIHVYNQHTHTHRQLGAVRKPEDTHQIHIHSTSTSKLYVLYAVHTTHCQGQTYVHGCPRQIHTCHRGW